jgi:hypothetical protein
VREPDHARRTSRKAEATSPRPIRRSIGKESVGMLLGAIPPSGVEVLVGVAVAAPIVAVGVGVAVGPPTTVVVVTVGVRVRVGVTVGVVASPHAATITL